MKETQQVTRGIKHWGLSGYSSVLPRIKFGVTRQESSPQSPTFHTAIRYGQPLFKYSTCINVFLQKMNVFLLDLKTNKNIIN